MARPSAARTARGSRPAGQSDEAPLRTPRLAKNHLDLDRLIFERVRLGIMSALAVNKRLNFNELKGLLGTSDGNLSAHARKLEDANYIACQKSFDGRRPNTEYRLTSTGRKALNRYLDHMEAVIRATRDG